MKATPIPGDRVSYTAMYDVKPGTRYKTHYGRVTSVWPPDAPAMCRIAVEDPRPHEARYVTRKLQDVALAPQESRFEPLPDDYLDDDEALELLAGTVTHIPGDWAKAAEMLSAVLSILRRNDRIEDGA